MKGSAIELHQTRNQCTHRWSRRCGKDQSTEVGSALVAEGASRVDESTNTVGLEGGASEGSSPGGGGRGSLLGLEELLLRVGGLCLTVGVTKDGAEDGQRHGVVEDGAEGNGRRLDRREV